MAANYSNCHECKESKLKQYASQSGDCDERVSKSANQPNLGEKLISGIVEKAFSGGGLSFGVSSAERL
jgi:hypothetical protein